MPRASRKIGMIGVENHDVCPPVGLDRPDRLRKRLGPTCERRRIEAMARRFTFTSGEYISGPMMQTLAVLQLAQLCRRVNLDVGVRANTIDATIG